MSLNRVPYTDYQTHIGATWLNGVQDEIISTCEYTTCSTAENTAAKTATMADFVLAVGASIKVKFTYSNTAANPSLNINSTGARAIKRYGSTAIGSTEATSWKAGAVLMFVYDGSNWLIIGAPELATETTIASSDCVNVKNTSTINATLLRVGQVCELRLVENVVPNTSATGWNTIFNLPVTPSKVHQFVILGGTSIALGRISTSGTFDIYSPVANTQYYGGYTFILS